MVAYSWGKKKVNYSAEMNSLLCPYQCTVAYSNHYSKLNFRWFCPCFYVFTLISSQLMLESRLFVELTVTEHILCLKSTEKYLLLIFYSVMSKPRNALCGSSESHLWFSRHWRKWKQGKFFWRYFILILEKIVLYGTWIIHRSVKSKTFPLPQQHMDFNY